MRTATKSTLGLVSLGLFAASYQIGLTAETGFALAGAAAPTTESSATPTPSASATETPTTNESGSASASATPTASATPSASATSTPTASKSSTSTASVSKTSDAIDTGRDYGFVQVEVVKVGNTITEINMIRAEATDGRAGAFPSLVAAAISANGTDFGNITQATYTTKAFKKAVESALAKF